MSFGGMQRVSESVLRTRPKAVQFTLFTNEDIRKLAVCKIISSTSFDQLGHPLPGGLYDKRLGPVTDRAEPCQTCQQPYFSCPGHFGYISLPLPVVHPLFHKVIAQLLKYSCLQCFHIQIPGSVKHVLDVHSKLLARGLLVEAEELGELMRDLMGRYDSVMELPEPDMLKVSVYEALMERPIIDADAETNKNIESMRNKTQYDVWRGIRGGKRCLYCQAQPGKITAIRRKLIVVERQKLDETDVLEQTMIRAMVSKPITPEQSREYIRKIWTEDSPTLKNLFPVLQGIKAEYPTDVFYMDVVAVPPCNIRPLSVVNGRVSEHSQTAIYKRVFQDSLMLKAVMLAMRDGEGGVESLPPETRAAYAATRGATPVEKLSHAWDQLQADVDALVDNDNGKLSGEQGLKQIIEKKAGIIRQHMMGKRVNFAARSVITPDPNLSISEIGIPEVFAKHLTYPVPVTSWNVEEMRKLIMNGPKKHPGAVSVEFENGRVQRIPDGSTGKESILKRLLTPDGPEKGFRGLKTVHRHLCNGDMLLLNRQPTLHRPSIMAHTARVLKDEKTLRLHYANCKAYNADFDGDEMNAHFPQNEIARAEGYHIANVANQYLGPKDGAPLSGLIQDHMIAGVKMSLRGRFFDRMDYQELCYQALASKLDNIILLPPAIRKPRILWSGKQVLSTVIINVIPRGRAAINLTASAKIPAKAWLNHTPREWKCGTPFKDERTMSEAEVVIRSGELLVGVLDKTHYGATPYGLVHCMYELYGGACAIKLLSAFAKLFTCFLQMEGFTLGVEDILVRSEADAKRSKTIKQSRNIGMETMRKALNVGEDLTPEELVAELERQAVDNPKLRALVDRTYKSELDSFTNDVNKACLPAGLVARFPANNLQLMVQSGAKGSTVNTMQISCMLGQIELEGKRPPVMISGRSLPSFPATEFSPRAGGYIDGRFMTGIQPQEFFFHCMAGREGLIDTAVKTSRSGYLQRCLIKHLEGVRVGYDMTVRDSDQSVIQFCYGEDGMDISKAQFLNKEQMRFLADNAKTISDGTVLVKMKNDSDECEMNAHRKDINEWITRSGGKDPLETNRSPFTLFSAAVKGKVEKNLPDAHKVSSKTGRTKLDQFIVDLWRQAGPDVWSKFTTIERHAPPPITSRFQPDAHFGALNERLQSLVDDGGFSEDVRDALRVKAMQSFAPPGDPVGLLAAQSIGEPSTQMTLNTFHFAGRGEMNVTLGIPRLREILMMASKTPKTPSMEVPFLEDAVDFEDRAEKLLRILTRVTLSDVLEKIIVTQKLVHVPDRKYSYTLKFRFLPRRLYRHKFNVTPKKCLKFMEKTFFKMMFHEIKRRSKMKNDMATLTEETRAKAKKRGEDDDEEGAEDEVERDADEMNDISSEDEPEDQEDAKTMSKFQQINDDQENDSSTEDQAIKEEVPPSEDDDGSEAVRSHTVHMHQLAENYVFDTSSHEWCEIVFSLPLGQKQFDLTALLRDVAARAVIWETPGVKRAIAYNEGGRRMLRTDGVNFTALSKYADLLDLRRLYSNDVHRVACTYGVEAAARVVVREVKDVFRVYGIGVDARHLSLIADYMTFGGSFEPLNRKGMESSASPLQQMSFESSLTFLRAAVLSGKRDALRNPSACLMLGKPCAMGTGAFGLLHDMNVHERSDALKSELKVEG